MEQLEFNFRKDTFSNLFPFYILLDANLCIKSYGKSIPIIIPQLKKTLFKDIFSITRPHIEEYSSNQLNNIINQLLILKSNYTDETILRGQFEIMDEGYLFIGSPWFVSVDEVVQKKLAIDDFAFHDSLLDIVHVTKNHEINYNDLKDLLQTVNDQRNILKKEQEEKLLKLEKQNKSLNDYAHMVSHDLKSPLRSIHTLISWIKKEKDMLFTENGKKYMDMIVEKVEKMDYLIDGLLAISKLDTTAHKYQEVDLNEILTIITATIHIPSNVTIEIRNKFPTIYTDKYRIQQLFQNLISNAVNYSNKKAGKVTVTYKDIDDFHLFSIKDNGIGIEQSYHEKIFDIFESYSDDTKSTGIGLSIVKKIIENYKGEIWLESELNKGTTFYFKIPKVNDGAS